MVQRLCDDPAFLAAMEAAGGDEAVLAAASRLVAETDRWIGRLLGL